MKQQNLVELFESINNFDAIYVINNEINNLDRINIHIMHKGEKLKLNTLYSVSYINKNILVHPKDKNKKIEWEDLIASSPTNNFNFSFHGVE